MCCNGSAESVDDKQSPELGMKYDEPEAAVLLVACAIGLATGAAQPLLITIFAPVAMLIPNVTLLPTMH